MQKGLQLNPVKSEALFMDTATQLRAVSSLTPVSVADVDLPVADSMRVLGVTLDRRLTFDNYASAVARSCNYHARAIRHIHHLLTLDLAQTLACSRILSRIHYCNSVLYTALLHHSEASASPEQRGAYRSLSASTFRRQLAASNADQLQVGRADAQDSADVILRNI